MKNIAIIGAGPAGLIAAEIIASAGFQVTIYDRMPTFARKFMMAGRGGLNLTHSENLEKFLKRYGAAANWLAPNIESFTPQDLQNWCEGLGQKTFIGSSGRVFPTIMKAAPLLRSWLKRLENLGVIFCPRHSWQGWDENSLIFKNAQNQIIKTAPDATLLTLGGASWPRLGSDGSWVEILAKYGVEIVPLKPANCGFKVDWSDYFSSRFAGQPLKSVAIQHQGSSHQGEIMITKQGIEGGAIYAISAGLRDAIALTGKAIIHLDLRPGVSEEKLHQKLQNRGNQSFSTYMKKAGFSALIIALLRECVPLENLSNAGQLAKQLKSLPVTLNATTGIERAISSAGGIKRDALDENFMLKAKPGVFAAGEMLDWEAPTGGYLLQGCFSTGVAAAKGILGYFNSVRLMN